jgi:hypothetical protein
MTDFYAFMMMALEAARKAGELTAQAELRVDLQPVVVCLPRVVTIVYVLLGDVCPPGGD